MENPLEQFAIKKLVPLDINGIDVSFTNSSLCMLITVVFILLTLGWCLRKRNIVPSMGQAFSESIYDFIRGIIGETMGNDGAKYVSLIFALFTYSNLKATSFMFQSSNMKSLLPQQSISLK